MSNPWSSQRKYASTSIYSEYTTLAMKKTIPLMTLKRFDVVDHTYKIYLITTNSKTDLIRLI